MKPRQLAIPIVILFFFSCKNNTSVTTEGGTTQIATKDTAGHVDDFGQPVQYIEHARLKLKDQVIMLTSRFGVVNGKADVECRYGASTNYFIYLNEKTGKADTLEAELENLGGCARCKYILRDMTDSFQSKSPVVQVVTPSTDIYYTNSFVGFRNGKFQQFFSVEDTREEGINFHREGSKLIGNTAGRDEVVDNLQFDYPVEIDTETFEVKKIRPVKQYIGWNTTATEAFRAYRVIGGRLDSSLVSVKAGDEVMVDTLYRASGKVRLHVADSVVVEIKAETARKKLGHNTAG